MCCANIGYFINIMTMPLNSVRIITIDKIYFKITLLYLCFNLQSRFSLKINCNKVKLELITTYCIIFLLKILLFLCPDVCGKF